MRRFIKYLLVVASIIPLSCSMSIDGEYAYAPDSGIASCSENSQGGGSAGKVTAGEWNDLDNWMFWSNLMTTEAGQDQQGESVDFAAFGKYWGFYTNNRVAVQVVDGEGQPVHGVKLELERNGQVIWSAVSDNAGNANCWISLFQKEDGPVADQMVLIADGVRSAERVQVTTLSTTEDVKVNRVVVGKSAKLNSADIAFIVDATGSMSDEINFLKADLLDILDKTSKSQSSVTFRTAALFYRDEGDEYVTRESNFADFKTTTSFISKQRASGGGDYPEAVHTALETSLQKLSWKEDSGCAKIAFMLLDAPAHYTESVLKSLHKSIETYAQKGIKLIPVAASGVDKNTEFMLRFFAIATGGTYVFITNDSGIGNDHIEASVGEYKVEALNDLIVRLITKYTE